MPTFSLQKNFEEESNRKRKNNPNSLSDIQNTKDVVIEPKYIYIIGIIAGILTSTAFAPQVFKAYSNKEKSSLTWLTLILAGIGQILWFTYGTLAYDHVIKIFASITLIMYFLLILSKFIFKNNLNNTNYSTIPNY